MRHGMVLFSVFQSVDDPLRRSWVQFRERLHGAGGDAHADGGADGGVVDGIWRLLAANHRELARSARSYASSADARAHVIAMQHRHVPLDPVVVSDPPGRHGWYCRDAVSPVMTGARWYATRAAAAEAAEFAVAVLALAEVSPVVLRMTPSRRRTPVPSVDGVGAGW